MSANARDNFKGTIIKFFLLALLALFFLIGGIKQLIYGSGFLKRAALPRGAGGQTVVDYTVSK